MWLLVANNNFTCVYILCDQWSHEISLLFVVIGGLALFVFWLVFVFILVVRFAFFLFSLHCFSLSFQICLACSRLVFSVSIAPVDWRQSWSCPLSQIVWFLSDQWCIALYPSQLFYGVPFVGGFSLFIVHHLRFYCDLQFHKCFVFSLGRFQCFPVVARSIKWVCFLGIFLFT